MKINNEFCVEAACKHKSKAEEKKNLPVSGMQTHRKHRSRPLWTHTDPHRHTHTHTLQNQTHICPDIHKVTQTGNTHVHTDTQICKLAVILISTEFEWLEIDRTLIPYLRKLRTVTEECRHGQLTILDQSLPRPSRLYSPAMVKIHGSHGECRKERDLYMNRECWCKFINMHQHCWGCYGQYNKTLCPDVICSSMLWEIDFQRPFSCFGLFMFLHPSMIWGNPAVRSNQTLLLPGSNRTAKWGTLTKERHERGTN